MYEITSGEARTQVGKTRERIKYGYHRWKEEPIYWNSRKCGIKNPRRKGTNQYTYYGLN